MRFPMHLDVVNALGWTFESEQDNACPNHQIPPFAGVAFYFVAPMDDIIVDDSDYYFLNYTDEELLAVSN